jgi:hypothetical protein
MGEWPPNYLCDDCRDTGEIDPSIGQHDDPQVDRTYECEECPTCEFCSDKLYHVLGSHLLEFHVGIRWCGFECFEHALDACVTNKARLWLLASVGGDFYARCIEDSEPHPNTLAIEERLREALMQYAMATASDERGQG